MEGMRSQINEMSRKIDRIPIPEIEKRQSQPLCESINLATIPEESETTETSHFQYTLKTVRLAEDYKMPVEGMPRRRCHTERMGKNALDR